MSDSTSEAIDGIICGPCGGKLKWIPWVDDFGELISMQCLGCGKVEPWAVLIDSKDSE